MKNRSKINKGLRFVNYLVKLFREGVDQKAYAVAGSGAGLDKMDIRLPNFNFEIEAKNTEKFRLDEDWEQVKRQLTTGNTGVLALRHPKKPEFEETLIVMDIGDFISLLQGSKSEVNIVNNFSEDLKWPLTRLRDDCKAVLKKIGDE